MSYKQVVTVTPGVTSTVPLTSVQNIQAVKVTNGTPFDLDYTGVGSASIVVIPAGLEYMFYSEQETSGKIDLLPVNNNNITGTGVVNITVFLIGDQIPKGTWPVTVPTQTVQAKVSTVTTLINDGSAVGTQIIESTELGSTGSNVSVLNDSTVVLQSFVAAVLTAYFKTIPGASAGASVLQLGDANRTVEIISKLLVDTVLQVTGAATFNGAGTGLTVTNNALVSGTLTSTGDATFNGAGSSLTTANDAVIGGSLKTNTIRDNVTGVDQVDLATAGLTVNNNINFNQTMTWLTAANQKLIASSGQNLLDASSGNSMSINPPNNAAGNTIQFDTRNTERIEIRDSGLALTNGSIFTLLAGGLSRMTGATATTVGSGTVITHGLGASPNYVTLVANIAQPGSATSGIGTIGSTTFTATIGAGSAASWSTKL